MPTQLERSPLGYKGESHLDSGYFIVNAGYFYCPYIPLDGEQPMGVVTEEIIIEPTTRLNGEWTVIIEQPPIHPCLLVELAEDVVEWWFR